MIEPIPPETLEKIVPIELWQLHIFIGNGHRVTLKQRYIFTCKYNNKNRLHVKTINENGAIDTVAILYNCNTDLGHFITNYYFHTKEEALEYLMIFKLSNDFKVY